MRVCEAPSGIGARLSSKNGVENDKRGRAAAEHAPAVPATPSDRITMFSARTPGIYRRRRSTTEGRRTPGTAPPTRADTPGEHGAGRSELSFTTTPRKGSASDVLRQAMVERDRTPRSISTATTRFSRWPPGEGHYVDVASTGTTVLPGGTLGRRPANGGAQPDGRGAEDRPEDRLPPSNRDIP